MHIPLYSDLARVLRERILNGKLLPGSRLPSERSMCDEFQASRITVRQALTVLEKEQLLLRIQGSGTYVSEHPALHIPLENNFTRSIQDHAPELQRKLIDHVSKEAIKEQADILKTVVGTMLLVARRQDRLKNKSTAWDKLLIPKIYAQGIGPQTLSKVNFLEAWTQKCNLRLTICEQRIKAISATEEDERLLGIAVGAPVLESQEVFLLENSRPAGAFITHYHPSMVGIRFEFPLHRNAHQAETIHNPA